MSRGFWLSCLPAVLVVTFFPFAHSLADAGDSCRASLSLDGEIRNNADPQAVAKACLADAAANDTPLSQYMAGLIYEYGIGEPKDSMKAKNRYRNAAYKGYAQAELALGRLFEQSEAFDWALAWYARAALHQNAAAQSALLRMKTIAPDEMWNAAVNAISIDDSQGGIGDIYAFGSGVVVSERVVVTNEHVVAGCTRVSVAPGIPAKVVAEDETRDLAILKTEIAPGAVATLAADSIIQPDEPLLTGGYPGPGTQDPTYTVTKGALSPRKINRKEVDDSWLLTNKLDPGNSGGPLVDEAGVLRGVVFASIPVTGIVKKSAPKRDHEGMAIPIETVKGFLDQHKIAYRTSAGPATAMSQADLDARLAAITVQINCFRPE